MKKKKQEYRFLVFENGIGYIWIEKVTVDDASLLRRCGARDLHSVLEKKQDAFESASRLIKERLAALKLSKNNVKEFEERKRKKP